MERFIESGKGFVGIRSTSDIEYDWDRYTKLIGRMFDIHPVIQTARLNTRYSVSWFAGHCRTKTVDR